MRESDARSEQDGDADGDVFFRDFDRVFDGATAGGGVDPDGWGEVLVRAGVWGVGVCRGFAHFGGGEGGEEWV